MRSQGRWHFQTNPVTLGKPFPGFDDGRGVEPLVDQLALDLETSEDQISLDLDVAA